MKQIFILGICVALMNAILGCETINGVSKDIGNTARNLRDVLGLGREIGDMTK